MAIHMVIFDFDSIIISNEVNLKKPDNRIFELALERLDSKAEETLFVGDHPVNDILGAQESLMHTASLRGFRPMVLNHQPSGHGIDSLLELTGVINRIG